MGRSATNNIAILIFANSSQEELKYKGIPNSPEIFDALTEQTLATVAQARIPFFHFTENQQLGTTFGERFTNAIQSVFDQGFGKVITIGNDAPQLRTSHILEAIARLNANEFVIGPSTDGGFYLMGIDRSLFDRTEFKKMAWQTSALSRQLLQFITGLSIPVFKLPVLFDIDTTQDIKAIAAYTFRLPIRLLVTILKFLQSKEPVLFNRILFVPELQTKSFYNKGSPISIPS